jgi:trk system potassium uptake protein TrkH
VLRSSISKAAGVSRSLGGKALKQREVESAMAVIFGYVGVVFLSFVVFLAYGQPPIASLFEVVSAVGTVGLSSGLS